MERKKREMMTGVWGKGKREKLVGGEGRKGEEAAEGPGQGDGEKDQRGTGSWEGGLGSMEKWDVWWSVVEYFHQISVAWHL